jgi:hypothetical protein
VQSLTITIESNALSGAGWTQGVAELLRLSMSCPQIDIRRTAGTQRESSRPVGDSDAAERRRLALTVPPLVEAFTLGLSELGSVESHLAEDNEPAEMEALSIALWDRPPGEIGYSDLEDVAHLCTHLRQGRDIFVSTDERMHKRRQQLDMLNVRVRSPEEVLATATEICSPISS